MGVLLSSDDIKTAFRSERTEQSVLQPENNRMQLTAPLGGRAGNGEVDAAASRSPFGERRRRS